MASIKHYFRCYLKSVSFILATAHPVSNLEFCALGVKFKS